MSEPPPETVQLIAGLISHMKQIVGDGACYAMLHYGAMEEGKRLGAGNASGDFQVVLEKFDKLLQHHTELVKDDGATLVLRVHSSEFLATGHRAVQGIILGLVEGALTATRNARYKGAIVQSTSQGEMILELTREA